MYNDKDAARAAFIDCLGAVSLNFSLSSWLSLPTPVDTCLAGAAPLSPRALPLLQNALSWGGLLLALLDSYLPCPAPALPVRSLPVVALTRAGPCMHCPLPQAFLVQLADYIPPPSTLLVFLLQCTCWPTPRDRPVQGAAAAGSPVGGCCPSLKRNNRPLSLPVMERGDALGSTVEAPSGDTGAAPGSSAPAALEVSDNQPSGGTDVSPRQGPLPISPSGSRTSALLPHRLPTTPTPLHPPPTPAHNDENRLRQLETALNVALLVDGGLVAPAQDAGAPEATAAAPTAHHHRGASRVSREMGKAARAHRVG